MSFIDFSTLNEPQRQAVECTEGPLLILAGAGSGKTRVLTYRIAHIIADKNVAPWNILAITFTNKAAKEMRERLIGILGDQAADIWVSTFHSMCAKILRRDIEKLGYTRSFAIYDETDAQTLLKQVIKDLNLSDKLFAAKDVKYAISSAKNILQTPAEYLKSSHGDFRAQKIHDIYVAYEKRLKENNALDFDDLLVKTLDLFAQHPPVLEYYRNKFMYIHVDEYQDTNTPQYMLVNLMGGKYSNVCVVGDDDQSIYSWRGADITNILNFEKDYQSCTTIKLEQNYRSTGLILSAANGVIKNNMGRKSKKLWTSQGDGDPVFEICLRDEQHEASHVVGDINKLMSEAGARPADFAVLYRANAQSRVMEEHLVQAGIPYMVYGGMKFYDRKEIKDIVSYLKLISNPLDNISLARIINVPKRSIGNATVEVIRSIAAANGESMFTTLFDSESFEGQLRPQARRAIENFANMMGDFMAIKDEMPLGEYVERVVHMSGLRAQFEGKEDDEAVTRIQNIKEFLGAVEKFASEVPGATLEQYLENVALVSDVDEDSEGRGAVTLMTMHSAKGLEFPYVYVLGVEEGVFPGQRSFTDPDRLEEERRLCYVAITRAEKRAHLLRAKQRVLFGMTQRNSPSRFLSEIPSGTKDVIDLSMPDRSSAGNFGGYGNYGSGHRASTSQASFAVRSENGPRRSPAALPGFGNPISTAPSNQTFAVGDSVSHPKFGAGKVSTVDGSGARQTVTIAFDSGETKKLISSIAPLTKL